MSENIIFNSKTKNIKLFKKIYLLLIISCALFQIVISENFIDYKVLGLLILMNLIALFYCLDENDFFHFPISSSAIFFSIFFNSAGALFLKTLELQKVSTGLYTPYEIYKFLFIANLVIIFTHWYYKKKFLKKENTFLFNLNNKLGLFDVNLNFIYVLGILAILCKFFINPFTHGAALRLDELGDYPIWIDFLRGFTVFYYLPFLLILSVPLFKKEFKVNKKMMFILILSVIYLSVGTNRRDIFLFGLLSFILMTIIVFLLNKIKFTKKHFLIISVFTILVFAGYEKLVLFSKVYVIERHEKRGKTLFQNVSSFYDVIKKVNSGLVEVKIYEDIYSTIVERGHFYNNYYRSHIFERLNPIKYSDNVLFYSKELNQRDVKDLRTIAYYRVVAVVPQNKPPTTATRNPQNPILRKNLRKSQQQNPILPKNTQLHTPAKSSSSKKASPNTNNQTKN